MLVVAALFFYYGKYNLPTSKLFSSFHLIQEKASSFPTGM